MHSTGHIVTLIACGLAREITVPFVPFAGLSLALGGGTLFHFDEVVYDVGLGRWRAWEIRETVPDRFYLDRLRMEGFTEDDGCDDE